MEDKEIFEKLSGACGSKLARNVPLHLHTKIGIGGEAKYFYVASTIDDLIQAALAALKIDLPFVVLGDGSTVIFRDEGYPGLVIKNESRQIVFNPGTSEVIVDSGVELAELINLAASRDLGGLEFLAGAPGTVGGAIYGNLSSDRYEIADFVKSVTILAKYGDEISVSSFPVAWMKFSYHSSRLKALGNSNIKPVVLTARLQLIHRRKDEILKLMAEKRHERAVQPKNQKFLESFFEESPRQSGLPIEQILKQARVNGMRVGGAAAFSKNPNMIINYKNAQGLDMFNLAAKVRETVKGRLNINIRERVEFIGQW